MRILVVSSYFPPHFIGGAELVAYQQARALAARGHEVRVFAGDISRQIPGYALREDNLDGLPVSRVALRTRDFDGRGNNLVHPEVDRHFLRLIERWRPDVIHAHHLLGLSLGIPRLARARGIRLVMTLHDHWGFCANSTLITRSGEPCRDRSRCHECIPHFDAGPLRLPQRLRQGYLRWQLQAVDRFVSPSHYLADAYREQGIGAGRLHVIANGIDPARFAAQAPAPPGERLRLLFIGYMGPHKGLPVLLDALAQLPGQRLHVDFVGDGHARKAYQARLAQSAPQLSVRFWGRLPNSGISERLAAAQLLVLPSTCPENQPVTITEAMASGLPVVASRIGGIPELVEHGVTGLLAAPGDAGALAACLRHYLEQPDALAAHGQAARQRIRAFAFDEQVERLQAVLAAPPLPPTEGPPLVACHGAPDAEADAALRAEFGTVGPQPLWLPASWLGEQLADLLWVCGAEPGDPALAARRMARYLASGLPVLREEGRVPRLPGDAALAVRGPQQSALAQQVLLRRPVP